jgi:hypothetical protein
MKLLLLPLLFVQSCLQTKPCAAPTAVVSVQYMTPAFACDSPAQHTKHAIVMPLTRPAFIICPVGCRADHKCLRSAGLTSTSFSQMLTRFQHGLSLR